MTKRLKKPPIYAEILAKKVGQQEDATAEFCIKVANWLVDLKAWALNIVHTQSDAQDAIEQLVKTLSDIEYYLPISELKTKKEQVMS